MSSNATAVDELDVVDLKEQITNRSIVAIRLLTNFDGDSPQPLGEIQPVLATLRALVNYRFRPTPSGFEPRDSAPALLARASSQCASAVTDLATSVLHEDDDPELAAEFAAASERSRLAAAGLIVRALDHVRSSL